MTTTKLKFSLIFLFTFLLIRGQSKSDQVFVDDNGIMHWSADSSEILGFGVNYTTPFAHEYRMVKQTGISLEEAMRQDVYHMARLDLDLYRVHVWDTEISDSAGNLLNNEHLRLFDFLIQEMKNRGMHFIITPIAYWGNGWPENDERTPGFSCKYGKDSCLTNKEAIKAQANYLIRFLNHVNTYTGIAYKDEKNIIAYEICNEPHHHASPAKVTAFINTMTEAIRATGCTKPVFYNVTQNMKLIDSYLNANIQGVTFQWYPTNLMANHEIKGNFLPQVSKYPVPCAENPVYKKMAKIIYEFDPADVSGNILYAAMAKAFREAGMQLACQFAYDAMSWAPYNTNYGTHFMNLAYAPSKAISLKVASAIFHTLPLYKRYENLDNFEGFRVSYNDNLAEWVTNEKFFYSNNTGSKPADASLLKEIAGCGSSPLVKYCGSGAYFLDKLSDGIWRLEVMPNVCWVEDPYSPVNPAIQKAAVYSSSENFTLTLPNLGAAFSISAINNNNTFSSTTLTGQFAVKPGVYLLKRNNIDISLKPEERYKNIKIGEFAAPQTNLNKVVCRNYSPNEIVEGKPLMLNFEAASVNKVKTATVSAFNGNVWKTITAVETTNKMYNAELPSELLKTGLLYYRIFIEDSISTTCFPGEEKGNIWGWTSGGNKTYCIKVVPENTRLVIWNAETDWEYSFKIWNKNVGLKPTAENSVALSIRNITIPAFEAAKGIDDYTFKYFFGDKIKGRADELSAKKWVVIKASNFSASELTAVIGLIDKNGSVLAGETIVKAGETIFRIPFSSLKNAPYYIIPRPFPDYMPYKTEVAKQEFDRTSLQTLQCTLKSDNLTKVNINIEEIWLE